MTRTLVFIRLTLGWEDVGVVREYVGEMDAALRAVDGFKGIGGWKGVDDPYARLILIAYESSEAAGRAVAVTSEMPTLVERLQGESTSPDVKVVAVDSADGLFEGGLPTDALVSASVRVAEPGYGPEMIADYANVFGGLMMLPGYAGSLIGAETKMTDEVVGLAAWRRVEAFVASMPDSGGYTVELYEPLGEA